MTRFSFRAWYPDEKRMEYQKGKTPEWVGDILTNSYYIPMQSTGLLDKNGKEIFESDIVHETYLPFGGEPDKKAVKWDGSCWSLFSADDLFDMQYPAPIPNDLEKSWEIIGNIYEHPELLKS